MRASVGVVCEECHIIIYYFSGFMDTYIFLGLVKHGVLTLVCEIRCYSNACFYH